MQRKNITVVSRGGESTCESAGLKEKNRMRERGAASNTSENPKSEASASALEVLKGKRCKFPKQRSKKAAAATDVYIRGNLCERSKKLKSVRKKQEN